MIREAKIGDIAAIHDLIVQLAIYEKEPNAVVATAAEISESLFGDRPVAYAHVAEIDGVIVGIAIWFLNFSTWQGEHGIYLEDLFIRPQYRGQGWGKKLLQYLAAKCNDNDWGRFQWWVLDWNTPAIEVYKRLGAVPMDEWTVYRLTGDPLNQLGQQGR